MNILKEVHSRLVLLYLLFAFTLLSCKEDDEPLPAVSNAANPYEKVNTWILDNMKTWYLWNDKIPESPQKNLSPTNFFQSLLFRQEDRFSWIQENYIELLNSLKGINKEAGYEFVLYRENQAGNNVIAQLLYVKKNSPAGQAGLKRGDIVTHINGERITTSNYRSLLEAMKKDHSVTYKPLVIEERRFSAEKTASVPTIELTENPNHLHRVLEVNGRKIGYYVYTFFAPGTDKNPGAYDQEMDQIFQGFKSNGITDLVLDLRFNSGGSESSARNLASLIGTGVNTNHVFVKREYNEVIKREILKDPKAGESYLTSKFLNKSQNIGNQLRENRLYVLTSSRTASASELIINGLKPYMNVFIIGDTTYGKNVGSVSLYEENNPENTWGLQPIVMKAYNSLSQSDYSRGFAPNAYNPDNSLYLYPLGDRNETLLSQAIAHITGEPDLGRRDVAEDRQIIGHSLDAKRRSYNLIVDDHLPPGLND